MTFLAEAKINNAFVCYIWQFIFNVINSAAERIIKRMTNYSFILTYVKLSSKVQVYNVNLLQFVMCVYTQD